MGCVRWRRGLLLRGGASAYGRRMHASSLPCRRASWSSALPVLAKGISPAESSARSAKSKSGASCIPASIRNTERSRRTRAPAPGAGRSRTCVAVFRENRRGSHLSRRRRRPPESGLASLDHLPRRHDGRRARVDPDLRRDRRSLCRRQLSRPGRRRSSPSSGSARRSWSSRRTTAARDASRTPTARRP